MRGAIWRWALLSATFAVSGCAVNGKADAGRSDSTRDVTGNGGRTSGGNPTQAQGGDATNGGAGNTGPTLALPIEVLGSGAPDEPVVSATNLALATPDASAVQKLYVRCHRCGFYDPPEHEALNKPLTKIKASLRIVGNAASPDENAAWIDVTDQTVSVDPVALAHGGINGGLVSLSFTLAIDAATRTRMIGSGGTNRIEFRFNGTEGNSNGYRILDVQFQDAAGNDLSPVTRTWVDIAREKEAGKTGSEAATLGAALWSGRDLLIKSPIVPRKIRAACNDCHATDGRDLQYFNYSDHSIVQRSRFHGLSEEQGRQIAAYLRSTTYASVPHVPAATPWNPPYQPGPGLDQKPIVEWAAGAGLDAVLNDGKAFVNALVGKPANASDSVTQAEIDAAFDPTKVLNTREMPIPLQLPDWNSWLPIVHPLDIWTPEPGASQGLFETGAEGANPLKVLRDLETWLTEHKNPTGVYADWKHLTADERGHLNGMLGSIGGQTLAFGGGGRGTRQSSDASKPFRVEIGGKKLSASLSSETAALAATDSCGPVGACTSFGVQAFIERADYGLYHWMAVKQWEIVHTWGLEEHRTVHGTKDASGTFQPEGEVRGWPYSWPSVFYVAPHMIYAPERTEKGLREFYFSWEKRLISYYRTNQWYQLQMTVNPGWAGASNGPMDWPYHQGFTTGVVDDLNHERQPAWISAAHEARFFQIIIKLAQLANTNLPFNAPDPKEPDNLFKNVGMQSKADLLYKLSPSALVDSGPAENQRTKFRQLDEIAPGMHVMLLNGAIRLYNALYASTDPNAYRRCDPNNLSLGMPEHHASHRFCADQGRTPFPLNDAGKPHLPGGWGEWTTQQFSFWGAQVAAQLGADHERVKTWSDWNQRMWPE